MTEQLSLFTVESTTPQIDILPKPKKWEGKYKDWSGTFEIVRSRRLGKSASLNYDIAIDIFDSDGDWQTLVEITTPLISSAGQEFRDTVDRLSSNTHKRFGKIPLTDLGSLQDPSLSIGDWVRLKPEWLDRCAATVSQSQFQKDYQYQTESDLISQVTWVDPLGRGHIYARRPNSENSLFVPGGCYSPVSELSIEYKSVPPSPVSESAFRENHSLTPDDSTANENHSLTGVNTYKPAGTAGGDLKYFRYSYREQSRVKHLHIPGGNTAKPKAQTNAEDVRRAIASGKSQEQIKQMIRSMC